MYIHLIYAHTVLILLPLWTCSFELKLWHIYSTQSACGICQPAVIHEKHTCGSDVSYYRDHWSDTISGIKSMAAARCHSQHIKDDSLVSGSRPIWSFPELNQVVNLSETISCHNVNSTTEPCTFKADATGVTTASQFEAFVATDQAAKFDALGVRWRWCRWQSLWTASGLSVVMFFGCKEWNSSIHNFWWVKKSRTEWKVWLIRPMRKHSGHLLCASCLLGLLWLSCCITSIHHPQVK